MINLIIKLILDLSVLLGVIVVGAIFYGMLREIYEQIKRRKDWKK